MEEIKEPLREVGSDGRTLEYASFWIRLWALILDGLALVFTIYFIGFFIMWIGFVFVAIKNNFSNDSISLIGDWAGRIFSWLYFIILTYKYQATFGKQMAGIKIVSKNGERASLLQIITRETVGKFLSALTIVGWLMPLVTKRKQALHDKIAGTFVIYS